MLRSQKKIVFMQAQPTHVDVFVEHYDLLKQWALNFTKYDRELAEDLLHDTFIHFTLTKSDLATIQNLESYLYVSMRNLHLSQIRKATRIPTRSLAVVEYDTVDLGLWASDPRDRLRLRDDLSAICQYACIRKETIKAGSVLILRFFHGYYPEEIADVMRSTRAMVHNRLKQARVEARTYLEDPDRLSFLGEKLPNTDSKKIDLIGADLRLDLRKQIFGSKQGECISPENLPALYAAKREETIDTKTLAHCVSCQDCLDRINTLLGLPLLASRYPLDMIGKDPGPKNKTGGDGTGGGAGGSKMLDFYINRKDAFYHHQPEELCVSVNGLFQGAHKVTSDKNEMRLVIDMPETVGFVEVFSEQGIRLLMLNVEPPPAGEGEQSIRVNLSSGRTLDANLTFSAQFPSLQISYSDPSQLIEAAAEITDVPSNVPVGGEFSSLLKSNKGFDWRSFFEPIRIAVAAVVLMFAAFGVWLVNQPSTTEPIAARAVLKQAREAEFALAPTADKVLHRNYQVEEWSGGNLRVRKRIDEWRQKVVMARRTYDERGQMIAGEWTLENGSQQVFEQGERLRMVNKSDHEAGYDPIANLEPTVNDFANLIDSHGVTSRLVVDEMPTEYKLDFRDPAGETEQRGVPNRLLVASLTLDRATYNPVSQTIVLQIGGEVREYRFTDVRVEQKRIEDVSPLIFEPEAELTRGSTQVTKPLQIEPPRSEPGALATAAAPANNAATLETEVEVFKALDSINALSGDQISITRTGDGKLRVTGIVDSVARKTEILNALAGVRNAPGMSIDVQTALEAQAAKKQQTGGKTGEISVDDVTAEVRQKLPVEPELRVYFARRGISEDRMPEEVRTFSTAVLNRAEALSRNALALKSLAERFSPADIDRLGPKKREEWKWLVRSKAGAIAGDVRSLQSQLSIFGNANVSGDDGGVINDAADAARSSQRLFGLAAACERQVSQSFSISSSGRNSAPVKSAQFWKNLKQMADLAADLQKF